MTVDCAPQNMVRDVQQGLRSSDSVQNQLFTMKRNFVVRNGASLKSQKYLDKKCFGFTKMDAGEIPRIKKTAFAVGAWA